MKKITVLRGGRGHRKQVNIFLDGKFAFGPEAEKSARKRADAKTIAAPGKSDNFQHCFDIAVRYLSYRPRSESELIEKLRQRGADNDSIEAAIARLKELGLVDDSAFAEFWKENRESFSPRSRWLTGLELRRKGVANDIIDRVVEAIDDDDSAYRAALNKVRNLSQPDYQKFRQQLGGYLKRHGFSYSVINHTVERLWHDRINHAGSILP